MKVYILHERNEGTPESNQIISVHKSVENAFNQIMSQEYELTRVYMATPNEANWNALSDIRRHGQLQEEHLENLQQNYK